MRMMKPHMSDRRPLPPQPPPMPEILAERAARLGEQPFAIFDDRTLSYRELYEESQSIAAGLQAQGVVQGDPVVLLIGNRSEFLTAFFALAYLGALAVPVNVALKGRSLAHVLEITDARIAIVEPELLPRIGAALGGRGAFEQLFVLGDPGAGATLGTRRFAELRGAAAALAPARIGPGDPWAVLFTSGTTGAAKGVTLPHQQIASASWDAVHDLELNEASVFYTFNPLFHLNALIYGPMAAIWAGARTVVRASFPREHSLNDARAAGATHWSITPFLARALLAAPHRADDARTALRKVMCFGLTGEEVAAFEQRFGTKIATGYGCTETGMICRLQSIEPTTSGRVSDRCELRMVDEHGADVPPGETGEIWVRARQPFDQMLGYYRMPSETAAAYDGEWFRTGDLGRLDEQGWLHFVDRLKESLKRRGENISTFEVEQVLMSFPGITAAAVVGCRPTPHAEEEVRAFIELTDVAGATLDHAALIGHCARQLAYFMVPRFIDVVAALPRTAVGKIRKQELKEIPLGPQTFDVKAAGIEVPR